MNLLTTIFQMMGPVISLFKLSGELQPRLGSGLPYTVPRGVYQCVDGKWVGVSASSDTVAARVMKILGLEIDERFMTFGGRMEHRELLQELMGEWCATRTRDEVVAIFEEAEAAVANEELRAPVSGIISTTGVVSGQVVQAMDLIFMVVNPSKLLIEALAYDSNLSKNIADGKVDVNGKVIELKYLGGGQTLREQALPLTFSAKSDDLQFLPIGQPIRVFVNTDSKVTGVKAPSKSLVKSGSNQTIVWIKKSPEIFEPRTVVYEPLDGQNIVITSGIKDGERVITDGASLINQIR